MKKIIYIFILFLIISCFCIITKATEVTNVYLESNKDIIQKDEEVEISINLEDVELAACNFSLYFDNTKLEYVSNLENTNVIDNRIIYVWYDIEGGKNVRTNQIVKFLFKAKEEGQATFSIDGDFYNKEGQLIKTNFEAKKIQIGKEETILSIQAKEEQGKDETITNANLQNLRLDIEGLSPTFQSNVYEYYLTVSNDIKDIEVLAISQNKNAKIEITGNTNLKNGLNLINIEVTSFDKTNKNIYQIQVTKTNDVDLANSNLEILAIENAYISPPFDENETNYKTQISSDIENLNIFAVSQNEKAKVEITGGRDLNVGKNLVTIIVTAQNGFSKKKYQVEVYKRNLEEEEIYQEEVSKMQEKLEDAYEIEKLSTINKDNNINNDYNQNNKNNEKSNITIWVILGIIIGSIIISVVIFIYLKYNKDHK